MGSAGINLLGALLLVSLLGGKVEAQISDSRPLQSRAMLIDLANKIRLQEVDIAKLDDRLTRLAAQEKAKSSVLKNNRSDLTIVLGALQRISRRPTSGILSGQASAIATIRAGILLNATLPRITLAATRLQTVLQDIDSDRKQLEQERVQRTESKRLLESERQRLQVLIAERRKNHPINKPQRKILKANLTQLAKRAGGLGELVSGLDQIIPNPPVARPIDTDQPKKSRPFPKVKASLIGPVRGRLITRYGEKKSNGSTERGVSIVTPAGAHVVAPHDGRLVFAGPFRGYGSLLIIEHSGNYHSILAGLDRIDAEPGVTLTAGEPIGAMGDNRSPVLYIELRRKGRPIDPLPWLKARKGDVIG